MTRSKPQILQLNLGRLCNQICKHCHVTAGPNRKEVMEQETAEQAISLLDEIDSFHTVDITGGAPEMTPCFRYIVQEAHKRDKRVIDRCNLTILVEPGYDDLAEFLSDHQVDVVASLPCYTKDNVDQQRGDGAFEASIKGLQLLNKLGYGEDEKVKRLDLVYNPLGPSLPPSEEKLEPDYKKRLKEDFGISFNNLICIANMPIGRFKTHLRAAGQEEEYLETLQRNFNPATVEGLMCRNHLSVDWRGYLYDCDFNQMEDLPLGGKDSLHISDVTLSDILDREIATDDHCFGCTAGSGSSCGGALV